jgi:hypothetical protein
MFKEWGQELGLVHRGSHSRERPTDGVLFADVAESALIAAPVVALEVAASEHGKTLAGSIAVLELVSPALGLLVIQSDEIRRSLRRKGTAPDEIERLIDRLVRQATEMAASSRQRIEVWTFEQLRRRFQLATGRDSIFDTKERNGICRKTLRTS